MSRKRSTAFVENVYALCKLIPKGKVTTYKAIAEKLGCKSHRAVGRALKMNKEPQLIPCFKVVKSNGEIGGYCGSGQENIKKKVGRLEAEGIAVINGRINLKKHFFSF
ncbi:MAG: MGMT family protein [Nanoarchaeota archaeon]